jgi:hypothetical protein
VRGWIYIISNKAMPGLIKVGYSSKDPEERAKELDHTGTPHPYVVEYDMLIAGDLYQIEQQIHEGLSSYSEGKEWFRCSPQEAIAAIQLVCEEKVILESLKKGNIEKVETEKVNPEKNVYEDKETPYLIKRGKECEDIGRYHDAQRYYTRAERESSDPSVRQQAYELRRKLRRKSWERG